MITLQTKNFLKKNKRAVKIVFQLLGILCIFLIFRDLLTKVTLKDISRINYTLFTTALLLQFIGKCTVAISWTYILRMSGIKNFRTIDIFTTYSLTEIGKYLPGNVMHLVSRHVIFKEMSNSNKKSFQCIATELLFYLISFCVFVLTSLQPLFFSEQYLPYIQLASTCILLSFIMLFLLKSKNLIETNFRYLLPSFLGYLFFAFCLVLSFYCSVNAINSNSDLTMKQYAFSSSFSWLVGFVAPGLPGGIGIRDLVLLKTIESSFNNATLPLVIVTFRIISIMGDVLLYLFGTIVNKIRNI